MTDETVTKPHPLSPECIEKAAQWHALMQSGEVRPEDEDAFHTWHLIAENAEVYQRIVGMWGQVDSVELVPARKTLETVLSDQKDKARKFKQRTAGTIASSVLLAIAVFFSLQINPSDNLLAGYLLPARLLSDYSTMVGEHKIITLKDQTRIQLNTFSAINVEYTKDQRTIYLLQGEIQLDVAKDAIRPLIVVGDQGSARALGTQFIVRNHGTSTEVSVTESRVEVCPINRLSKTGAIQRCQQLQAGEKTQVNQNQVQPPQSINTNFSRDWAQQLLIVDNQPVLDVLDELGRYQSSYLRIDRQALARYAVSGVFPLDDFDKSLQVLEGSLPIKVSRYTPFVTVVEPLSE